MNIEIGDTVKYEGMMGYTYVAQVTNVTAQHIIVNPGIKVERRDIKVVY